MKGIEAIQQQYIYRVNPVNLFEQRPSQSEIQRSNIFASSNSEFSLNHPVVSGGSGRAESLDLLA